MTTMFMSSRLSRTAIALGFTLGVSTYISLAGQRANAASKNPADDCKDAVCQDAVKSFKLTVAVSKPQGVSAQTKAGAIPVDTPLNRESLGRAGWTILHTVAAHFPDNPTEKDKQNARDFIYSFAQLYPCRHCAEGLRIHLEESPPNFDNRENLSLWVCRIHNIINEELGKPLQPCNIRELDKRWRESQKVNS